ncbi:MAG: methyltransferase domain-containing protein, partial [Rhodocyclaceae bacterium]|nr:methyltransferase domain-containing protein [Rhodocyclaceae bacterium]
MFVAEKPKNTPRCTFHEGYLDSLPASDLFDAATCLLVSQFLKQAEERSHFFGQIAQRLHPDGVLINADLVLGMPPSVFQGLVEVWLRMQGSGWSEEDIEKLRPVW